MLHEYENLKEFIPKVAEVVDGKLFEHYILFNAIFITDYKNEDYLESYIIGNPENWIVGFCTQSTYLLYGRNWTDEQLAISKAKVDSIRYLKPFHFSGTAELVKKLTSNLSVQIFKDRIFYENKNLQNFQSDSRCSIAKLEDLDVISIMMCDYFEDEYEGKNNKNLAQMRIEVQNSIQKETIWILKIDNIIVSMCSTILTQFDIPIIGSFFTLRTTRNKGYGTILLSHVSHEMIIQFGVVTLLAHKNHSSSIKVFEKLNYLNVYETLEVAIN